MRTSTINGDSSFHIADIFARPTANALRAGWAGQGGIRIVNCLNRNQTGFPQLTYSMLGMAMFSWLVLKFPRCVCFSILIFNLNVLAELTGGPYQLNMVPSYLQMMRVQEVKNMAYIDLGIHDQRCEQAIGHMTAYVFDQLLPPTTWNGTWWGCTQVRYYDLGCSTK